MDGPTDRRASARTAGLVLACAVALILAAVVGVFAWRGGPPPTPAGAGSPPPPPAPDVRELPSGAGGLRQLGGGTKMNVTMMDRADPTRVAGELQADRSVPLENKRYRMDKPRVWIFLRDGRTVHIEADRGEALIPDTTGGRPEDGLIEGDVVMRLFAPIAGDTRPDPHSTTPLLKLTTQQMRFDGRAGEIRFPDEVTIAGDRVDFSGSGVLIVLNEGAERLELLRIEKTKELVLKSAKQAPAPVANAPPTDQGAAPAATPAVAHTPTQTLYSAWCEKSVKVEQATRSLSGERLEGWIRLVDNALPEGAIADARPNPPVDSVDETGPLRIKIATVIEGQPPAAGAFTAADSDAPVRLTWAGALEVRPLADRPPELANNDVFVRCTSPEPGGVEVGDTSSGVTGRGSLVEYAATTREAAIAGDDRAQAFLEKADSGKASGERFDVAMNTGRVTARGRGSLTGGKDREIAWEKEAEFLFNVKDGTIGSRIDRAMMQGTVVAGDGKGSLRGETLTAEFTGINDEKSFIRTLSVLGNARAGDGKDGFLSSDSLDVAFARRGETEESDPTTVKAAGHVRGERQGSVLTGDSLVANLGRDARDDLVVTTADAKGAVTFTRDDGVEAAAEELSANPVAQTVELRGEGARVGQRGSMVRGHFIQLDGTKKRLTVPGAGEFDHSPQAAAGEAVSSAHVSWSRGMTFDDATGIVECDGDAAGEMQQGPLSKDAIKADRIKVSLSPGEAKDAANLAAAEKQDRRLISLLATGKDGANPANVEVRRYAAADGGVAGPLERLMYLEGGEIRADNLGGTLDVPGAGKLLTLDKRESKPRDAGAAEPAPSQGSALFTWKESFSLNRREGRVTMRGTTRLVHDQLDGKSRVELEAAELSAQVSEAAGVTDASLDAPFTGELRSATATGSVWMRYDQKEVSADVMTYDAIGRSVDAQGTNGNLVTAFDPQTGTPVTATRVLWNLNENKFQLMGIQQPIVTPK